MSTGNQSYGFGQSGFTLIELVIIIVTVGILAAVAVPKFSELAENSKIKATQQELLTLKQAIVGNPSAVAGGQYVDRGFEGDVGHAPSRLVDLVTKPDSLTTYDPLNRLGWNGPYIDGSNNAYLSDAWGNNYVYLPGSRTIFSTGGNGDTIRVTF